METTPVRFPDPYVASTSMDEIKTPQNNQLDDNLITSSANKC